MNNFFPNICFLLRISLSKLNLERKCQNQAKPPDVKSKFPYSKFLLKMIILLFNGKKRPMLNLIITK